jgi:His/Glu/Gln/Arg/opine family amino acid ABC transporter permease subunit
MADVAAGEPAPVESPPDVRGPTAPLPLGTLIVGGAALVLVTVGSLVVQVVAGVRGGAVTQTCVDLGIRASLPDGTPAKGAAGVCHIVEGFRSPAETVLLVVALALGVGAAVVGFSMSRRMPSRRMRDQCVSGAVLGAEAVLLAAVILYFRRGEVGIFTRQFLNFAFLEGTFGAFITGAKNTLRLAIGGELGGIVIGLFLAMLAISERRVVRAPARAYINFFRGTPLIWQLSTAYFGVSLGLQLKVSTFTLATVVFALNTGAYAAEVFRAGLQSIERGQMEAARSLGFSYAQAMRYAIVPQAFRRVIPPLMNEFVILIKDTSLVFVIGLLASELELFSVGREIYSESYNATPFLATAAGYLIVTLPMIWVVNKVERRLRSGLVGIVGVGL